jgi:ferredoxin-type protein NapF
LADLDRHRRAFLSGRPASAPAGDGARFAVVLSTCLALRSIACMSCRDACAADAVRFRLVRGGAHPSIDAARCTGCGECVAVCPAAAIELVAAGPEAVAAGPGSRRE